jgi:hypothetical protein
MPEPCCDPVLVPDRPELQMVHEGMAQHDDSFPFV